MAPSFTKLLRLNLNPEKAIPCILLIAHVPQPAGTPFMKSQGYHRLERTVRAPMQLSS